MFPTTISLALNFCNLFNVPRLQIEAKRVYNPVTMRDEIVPYTPYTDTPYTAVTSVTSLRFATRPVPSLSTEDTLQRFLRVSAQSGCTRLPILQGEHPIGSLAQAEIQKRLESTPTADLTDALWQPISSVLEPATVTILADATVQGARDLFRREQLGLTDALPVVDARGYCVGMIVHQDLLMHPTDDTFAGPNRIGGMATPFGVYLTDGSVQAGASNLALVGAGAATGLMLMVAGYAAQFGWLALAHRFGMTDSVANLDVTEVCSVLPVRVALLATALKLTVYLVFFGLLRVTNIAGYHAAEHQTVHAVERNEPLVVEVVKRMPRPHPRCGTNVMGACLIFFTITPLLGSLLHLAGEDALIIAVVITFFTFRPLGTFLQQFFTTRPASDRQIASGIAAAMALNTAYYSNPPTRTRLLRCLWCQGLLQNLTGLLLVGGAQGLLLWTFDRLSHR